MEADLPSELSQAESLLEEHKRKKQEVSSLINYTADEGEKIVVRVRQTVGDSLSSYCFGDRLGRYMYCVEYWLHVWEKSGKIFVV